MNEHQVTGSRIQKPAEAVRSLRQLIANKKRGEFRTLNHPNTPIKYGHWSKFELP